MIKRHPALFAGLLLLLLGGCVAKGPALGLSVPSVTTSFFSCSPADGDADESGVRSVQINPSAETDAPMLAIGNGYPERLDAVVGSSGRLFANGAYAWRLAYPATVLTDIGSYQTYRCASR